MNIRVRNYYLGLLGMFGEIFSLNAKDHAPGAPTSAGDELRRMLDGGLIRYFKHPDRKRTYRICDPAGYEAIGNIDQRLLEHAELLTGKKGMRYNGSKEYRLKKRKEAYLMFTLASDGIPVDGAKIGADRDILLLSPSLLDAETIIRTSQEETPFFISGPLLRQTSQGMRHSRREMSTSTGTLFTKAGIYTTYNISTARFRWYAASEMSTANDILRLYEDAMDIERVSDNRLRSIIYTDTEAVASDLIMNTGFSGGKMDPTSIFKLCYLSPLNDKELSLDITRILSIPNWRIRADNVFGLTPSGKHDGETEDGRRVYNLLCCNLAKLHEISGDVRRNNARLIIHDWMEPVLKELYATDIDAIALSPKHFRGLLLSIEQNER